MCNPSLYYAASTAAEVGGAVVKGLATSSADKANAKIADYNADAATQQAAADEAQQRRESALTMGQSRVDYAASGVAGGGTALDMLAQQASDAELDALKIRAGGQAQATNYRNQARLDRSSADSAWVSSGFSAAGSLLNGATSWEDYQTDQKLLKTRSVG